MKADNDNLAAVHTLDEAAAHLRLTNRAVAKIARRHGLCMVAGRKMLFTNKDIEAIKDVLRCPSNSTSAAKSGGSAGHTSNNLYAELQELVREQSRKPSLQRKLRA